MIRLCQHIQRNPIGYEAIFQVYTPSRKFIGEYTESQLPPKIMRAKVKRFQVIGKGVGGIIRVVDVTLKEWDE